MANILVLGGSGFVSEALSKYLIRRGYSIDILTRGKKKISFDFPEVFTVFHSFQMLQEKAFPSIQEYGNC